MPKNKILFLFIFSFFAFGNVHFVLASAVAPINDTQCAALASGATCMTVSSPTLTCPGGRTPLDYCQSNTGATPPEYKNCCGPVPASPATPPPTTSTGGLQYKLLEKIPGAPATLLGSDLSAYVLALYNLALAIVVLSAVFMVSIGGFMYLTSAGNTSAMHTAKEVIFDALIGLVIALTAWLLLNVINPDLTNVSINGLSAIAVPAGGIGTGATPTPGTGTPGTCGGYAVSGINSSQCADASPALADLLKCIYDKDPNTKVNSISDSAGFTRCKTSWQQGICAHAATSCHYGGGVSKTASECQQSQAVDLSTNGVSAQAIIDAASACGGRINNEGNHIHVSTKSSCCTL